MNTIAYLVILTGAMMLRGAAKGRSFPDALTDIGNMVIAAMTNDKAQLDEVMAREGSVITVEAAPVTVPAPDGNTAPQLDRVTVSTGTGNGLRVLAEMKRLGSGAVYVWGATGPTGKFDCSGLVWRAMSNLGIYTGPRFTTHTYVRSLGAKTRQVGSCAAGCVVLWPEHMGVAESANTYYSAVGRNQGIKSLPIGTHNGLRPTFWEIV